MFNFHLIAFHFSCDWLSSGVVVGLLNSLLEYGLTKVDHMFLGGEIFLKVDHMFLGG